MKSNDLTVRKKFLFIIAYQNSKKNKKLSCTKVAPEHYQQCKDYRHAKMQNCFFLCNAQ